MNWQFLEPKDPTYLGSLHLKSTGPSLELSIFFTPQLLKGQSDGTKSYNIKEYIKTIKMFENVAKV